MYHRDSKEYTKLSYAEYLQVGHLTRGDQICRQALRSSSKFRVQVLWCDIRWRRRVHLLGIPFYEAVSKLRNLAPRFWGQRPDLIDAAAFGREGAPRFWGRGIEITALSMTERGVSKMRLPAGRPSTACPAHTRTSRCWRRILRRRKWEAARGMWDGANSDLGQ